MSVWRRFLIAGLLAPTVLLTVSRADADIGVIAAKPGIAAPGQLVDLAVGCGGAHCPSRFPVSLLAAGKARRTLAPVCEGKHGPCSSPIAPGIPRKHPYMFLGWVSRVGPPSETEQRYQLRFRVPKLNPGAYEFVVFADIGSPSAGGFLIADNSRPGTFLRVHPEQRSTASSGGGVSAWLIAVAALFAIAAAAAFVRRLRA